MSTKNFVETFFVCILSEDIMKKKKKKKKKSKKIYLLHASKTKVFPFIDAEQNKI